MYQSEDFDLAQALPANAADLIQDLELETLFTAMAAGDTFLHEVARRAVLNSLTGRDAIIYRQDVLRDCRHRPAMLKQLYELAVEAIASEKKILRGIIFNRYPSAVLSRAIEALHMFVGMLKRLRTIAVENAGQFQSAGFTRFFGMLVDELDDAYFADIDEHLKILKFRNGVLISAGLGKGNKGINYVLRRPGERHRNWLARVFITGPSVHSFQISDRDEAGAQALSELNGRGINAVASALSQSTDHILGFFTMLRTELGFYIGCLNVGDLLADKSEPCCYPVVSGADHPVFSCHGLMDVSLALRVNEPVVGNDVTADNRTLLMITGANEGGKSTFLRSTGQAQLMMQAGMPVAAQTFTASICTGIATHFKREEDPGIRMGKLDEELHRMSRIAEQLRPNYLMLFNESFAATNEREGSEIGRQIIRALLDSHIKVFCVTHQYDLAHGFYLQSDPAALFLRAGRLADGQRTYQLMPGEPLPTSYGPDLYERVFGHISRPRAVAAGPATRRGLESKTPLG